MHTSTQPSNRAQGFSRRHFLAASTTAAAFQIVPRHVLAGSGETPPSERVRVAAIGVAGRPTANIHGLANSGAEIVGLCDVDTRRTEPVCAKYPRAKFFKDYRVMLDTLDKQIDAVTIGTPDHWHAAIALECMKRGKHVQCEKPLAQSYHEVDLMIQAAQDAKVVNQAVNQGHAFDAIRVFREWVEAGLIGSLKEAHFWTPAVYSVMDKLDELKATYEIPKELDWELWQGPVAPHRAYCPLYLPGRWRFFPAYGCSTLGDWACHLMDPVFWTLDLDEPIAVTAECVGDWDPKQHGVTFPKGDRITLEFAAKGNRKPFKIVWFDGEQCKNVPTPPGHPEKEAFAPYRKREKGVMNEGGVIYGEQGIIQYGSHGAKDARFLPLSRDEQLRKEKALPAARYPRIPDGSVYKEWLQAITQNKTVGSDFRYAGRITQIALIAIAALFDPNKRLEWDAQKRCFKNSSAATARLHAPRITGFGV